MTHNKPSREEGLFPLPFLFLFYAVPSTICLCYNKGRNTAEIAQKQQAEGGKIK